jgi:hypothetical protein
MTVAAHLLPLAARKPILAPHQLQAAAHGRLVHMECGSSPVLGSAQFQNISDRAYHDAALAAWSAMHRYQQEQLPALPVD